MTNLTRLRPPKWIWIIPLLIAGSGCGAVPNEPARRLDAQPHPVNLLRGDPSFEVGLVAWHAFSAPTRSAYLASTFHKQRVAGLSEPDVTSVTAWHGTHAIELRRPASPDYRAYLIGAPVRLESGENYRLTGYAKCEAPANVRLRIASEVEEASFDSGLASETTRIGPEWTRLSMTFLHQGQARALPAVDLLGPGRCWFDAFGLSPARQASQDYVSPAPITLSLGNASPDGIFGKHLHLAASGETEVTVEYEARLFRHEASTGPTTLTVEMLAPENDTPLAKPIDRQLLDLPVGKLQVLRFPLKLPASGIWKLRATLTGNGTPSVTETSLATLKPHQGPMDTFFGTHMKWDPMVDIMGFGAIRDMSLLEWQKIQPEADRWLWPDSAELGKIQEFVNRGGIYLATLVGESPVQDQFNIRNWGKAGYGQIPQWAGTDRDSTNKDWKRTARIPRQDALASYVAGISAKMPYLHLEFMNEPLFYMGPEDYAPLLATAYRAARQHNPKAFMVAFANPPNWFYLADGARVQGREAAPYSWFNRAFELGAADNLDAISLHTYDRTNKKETPENAYGGKGQAQWAKGFERYLKPGQQIWISEKGISSPAWTEDLRVMGKASTHAVQSPITQARWIVRSQLEAKGQGIPHFFLWNRVWSQTAHERYLPNADVRFTLFEVDGTPRPALLAQKTLMENIGNANRISGGELGPGLRYELFDRPGSGETTLALWKYGRDEDAELASNSSARFPCPGFANSAKLSDMYGNIRSSCDGKQLQVGPSPVYLKLKLANSQQLIKNWLDSLK